jgi:sugar lactone lactonase YvrE
MRFAGPRLGRKRFGTKRLQQSWHALSLLPLLAGSLGMAQVQVTGLAATGAVAFPPTAIGSSAPAQSVQLVTQRAETITSIQVPPSMGGKQEFVVGTVTGCTVDGTTVNPLGAVCTVPITFTPAYPGPRNLPLQVVTGNGNSDIGLSGTGTGPLAVLAPGTATVVNFSSLSLEQVLNGVAVDGVGNAYAAVSYESYVVRVDATTGAVTTIAGTGYPTFNNDGIPATQADLFHPTGVAVDAAGDVFIADTNNNKVRGVFAATGLITSVAGGANGYYQASGFSGDGGPAYYALINAPTGLALDAAGDLYIADTGNNAVRRIDATSGKISSVAGIGTATAGYTGDGGLATAATLSSPGGIAVDALGDLFIADSGNNVIRRVDGVTGKISTIAGTGTAGFGGDGGPATQALLSGPASIAFDPAGNLYIADQNNLRLRKIEATTGKIFTVAGNGSAPLPDANTVGVSGTATSFPIGLVSGVAIDPAGDIYFATTDAYNNDILKISPPGNALLTYPTTTLVNTADTTDDPLSFTVSNVGNAPLVLTSPSTGTNPTIPAGWLADTASPCQPVAASAPATTVASGASCIFALDFLPTATGTSQGTVTLSDNSLSVASTQTASLSGIAASASATTTSLSFSFIPNYPPGYFAVTPSVNYDSIDTLTATVAFAAANVPGTINGTVTFYANGNAITGGTNLPVTNGTASFTFNHLLDAGTYAFTATFTPASGSTLNASTSSALNETISKGIPVVTITPDNHPYDGNPHGVTVTTVPANLPAKIQYNLYNTSVYTTTPPTLPGLYNVAVFISTTDYSYNSSSYLHIYSVPATVTLANLEAAYDGNPHSPTATTVPAGLNVTLTYNGSTTAPSAVGRYSVVGTVVDPIYAGTGMGTMEIYSTGLATTTWIVNQDSTVSHLSSAGAVTATVGTPSGTSTYGAIAIDSTGNAWSVTNANNSVQEVSPTGTLTGTYTVGGVSAPSSVAIDGAGQVWVANGTNSVTVLTNTGTAVSPSAGYLAATTNYPSVLSTPSSIAIDSTGSVWITNAGSSTVTRILGAAAPVVTPTVLGVSSSKEGSLP